MKTKLAILFAMSAMLFSCCSSYWLRQNTYSQTKTVSDFLADQVLYNLALSERFWNGNDRFNGIPSFVQLQTGQAQVQQSINGQLAFKFPFNGGDEIDPQISGNHQAQNNWAFQPVTDPNQLNRLFYLYKAEFTNVASSDLTKIFPNPPGTGPDGKPILKYKPVLTNGNQVIIINNNPQFTATYETPTPHNAQEIPGAINAAGTTNNPWFSFYPPSGKQCNNWFKTGPYLGKTIWITDKENFFNFAMLAFSTTNIVSSASSASMAPYTIQNGLFVPLR
jgi:hypothetical protein